MKAPMQFSGDPEFAPTERSRFELPFAVVIALVILVLSLLYALLFSHMVWISLNEQHFDPRFQRYRFEGGLHFHNPVEWFLLGFPAAAGWASTLGTSWFLWQRWRRRRQTDPA